MTPDLLSYVLMVTGVILTAFIKIILGKLHDANLKHDKLRDDHYALKSDMSTHYVSKVDFQYVLDNIFSQLARIEDKIDNKLDKKQ